MLLSAGKTMTWPIICENCKAPLPVERKSRKMEKYALTVLNPICKVCGIHLTEKQAKNILMLYKCGFHNPGNYCDKCYAAIKPTKKKVFYKKRMEVR
jgi:hypothetical protein